ncbi:MAG TPA: bifunctional riboflavin kinase/FAD synthetase [Bacteroidales bacterium]|nr:bifunctional riboflavin kinase/FAD synthetase [Bacteroidales bacterium]
MIIHNGCENLNLVLPVATLGIFDGVHIGHKALLDILVSRAKENIGSSVVITFNPHPRMVLANGKESVSLLTTLDEKAKLLENTGIDHLIIIHFDSAFSNLGAYDFVGKVLVKQVGTRHIIVGYDHHFGKHGEGDYNTIRKCAESLDFKVEQVPQVNTPEGIVSSSSIRDALLTGNLGIANRWLGYDYTMSGRIVEGRQLGRSLGFPTANINPADKYKLMPKDGVYAVEVQIAGELKPGMLSIGKNPTVNDSTSKRSIEVHIFDFGKNIYDNDIKVIFRYRLRDEMKFENIGQLAEQIKLDKQLAMRLLT